MLTRTNKGYQHISWRLSVIWFLGFFFRHFILFPIRFMVSIFGLLMLLITGMIIARLPEGNFKISLSRYSNKVTFRILARALSLHATYHDRWEKKTGFSVIHVDILVAFLPFHIHFFQGESCQARRNLRSQSHFSHRRCGPFLRQCVFLCRSSGNLSRSSL